jgi:Ca2+-binding EF-hand superfamily protein
LKETSTNNIEGISKLTFSQYYILPGIISDRLFATFNKAKKSLLSLSEFKNGMNELFINPFEDLCKFIFNMYDADSDGMISKEDVKTLMQYISLEHSGKSGEVNLK